MEDSYITHVRRIFPNLSAAPAASRQDSPAGKQGSLVGGAARMITAQSAPGVKKTYGRNDHVIVSNGTEEREMKYKKAEPLLATGLWRIVEK